MKYIASFIILALSSANAVAEGELLIQGSPLKLELDNHHQIIISSCKEFESIRHNGDKIISFPEIKIDRVYSEAKEALFSCWISTYTEKNKLSPTNDAPPSLSEVLQHFPASASFSISNYEIEKIKQHSKEKSILELTPDLKVVQNSAESIKSDTGYRLGAFYSFKNPKNKIIKIITLNGYALHGTIGATQHWMVDDFNTSLWKIKKIDENSPL